MAPSDAPGGGGGVDGKAKRSDRRKRPTPRWLRAVQEGNRLAFEKEMQRKRQGFDREFERFWRAHRQAS